MDADSGTAFVSIPPCSIQILAQAAHQHRPCLHALSLEFAEGSVPNRPIRKAKQAGRRSADYQTEGDLSRAWKRHQRQGVGTPAAIAALGGRQSGQSTGRFRGTRACQAAATPRQQSATQGSRTSTRPEISCFPGQGLNAVASAAFACGHRVGAALGPTPGLPDKLRQNNTEARDAL